MTLLYNMYKPIHFILVYSQNCVTCQMNTGWFATETVRHKTFHHTFGRFATALDDSPQPGMQIHIRPVARGDENYIREIVNQQVTSPAGDWIPVRSADHVWLFTHNCRAPHSIYRCHRRGALQSVVSTRTWLCVSETFTFEEHRSAHNSRFRTLKSEQLNQSSLMLTHVDIKTYWPVSLQPGQSAVRGHVYCMWPDQRWPWQPTASLIVSWFPTFVSPDISQFKMALIKNIIYLVCWHTCMLTTFHCPTSCGWIDAVLHCCWF